MNNAGMAASGDLQDSLLVGELRPLTLPPSSQQGFSIISHSRVASAHTHLSLCRYGRGLSGGRIVSYIVLAME